MTYALDPLHVLVTGASGLVGGAVITRLTREPGITLRAAYRAVPAHLPDGVRATQTGNLGSETEWQHAVRDIDVVIHCAARVHVMNDTEGDPLAAFRRANVDGTLQLARSAIAAGCRRFVFISSIKVNGESSAPGHPYTETMQPAPVDAYGQSKLEAENALFALATETGLEVVVIRPPLVYGPGVKANFRAMMRAVSRGIPLPLSWINNRRSLVAVDNLADLIALCTRHPAAANEVFFAGDGEDVSSTELLRRVGKALGKPARLLPVPVSLITAVASLLGRKPVADRLCATLQVDIHKARTVLGWAPPLSLDEGLRRAAIAMNAHPGCQAHEHLNKTVK
ncbi:MAG: UDP-glucose 4-epimerase family protein [Azoarcus sp.]